MVCTPYGPSRRRAELPAEFYWVVGCSYLGLPESGGEIRNPIGANMSMLTRLALEAGGFDEGNRAAGRQYTRLRRDRAFHPADRPIARISRHVRTHRGGGPSRDPGPSEAGYFISRCWHEGRSKADVVRLAGSGRIWNGNGGKLCWSFPRPCSGSCAACSPAMWPHRPG